MNDSKLTARDFLMNEYFLAWVLKPEPENTLYWENWLAQNPQHKPEADKAKELLSSDFNAMALPGSKIEKVWRNIEENTTKAKQRQMTTVNKANNNRVWYQVAAVFIGILLAGTGLWKYQQYKNQQILVTTEFGETKTVTLPDNSMVVLNGNSTLKYDSQWNNASVREVTLEGEAFFSVVHTRDDRKFWVKISDEVKVEVLGTKFTVTSRPRKTRVVLSEGEVKIDISKEGTFGVTSDKIGEKFMEPGDLLELAEPGQWKKLKVENPENYAAFLHDKIVFKDNPLSEVARVLEDTYGYKITFMRSSIATSRFTGSFPYDRVDILLKAIKRVFNLKIIQNGKEVIFKQ